MEIQCKSSAMQYPFYCNSASGSLCTVQAGQVDTHAPVQWSGVRANRLCLPHSPTYCGPGYMPHIIARPWAALQVRVIWGGVKLDDTSHRAHGTKVLTCTSVSSIVARNTDASKKRILFDCSWSLTCCYNHICVFLSFYSR